MAVSGAPSGFGGGLCRAFDNQLVDPEAAIEIALLNAKYARVSLERT